MHLIIKYISIFIILSGFTGLYFGCGKQQENNPQTTAPANTPDTAPKQAAETSPVIDTTPKVEFSLNHPAFSDDSDFEKVSDPKPGEWRYRFKERHQPFETYVRQKPNRPAEGCRKIYFQPIGEFNDRQKDLIAKTREYAAIFFQSEVVITNTIPLPLNGLRKRDETYGKWTQYLTDNILVAVLKPRLPKDAFCYMGITMADLYPDEDWNFVFGEADLRDAVGIYSLIRYFPQFYGQDEKLEDQIQILRRSCKVLTHEIIHMYGITHCQLYKCNISGSNSLEETDRYPIHLCPACLKKLAWNIGFDVIERETQLMKYYLDNKLEEEYTWTLKHLKKITESSERNK